VCVFGLQILSQRVAADWAELRRFTTLPEEDLSLSLHLVIARWVVHFVSGAPRGFCTYKPDAGLLGTDCWGARLRLMLMSLL
jgi:hypothetical protein